MEEVLKQILSEIKGMKGQIDHLTNEVTEVKGKVNHLTNEVTEVKGQIDHLTKETFKITVKLEDKIDNGLQALDFKLDKIYVNTVGVSKQFTDVTKQELPVINHRLHDHEDRITDLEARV